MSINLAYFRKPSRYIGNEVNSIHKDADVRVALCFPDMYEIGMSHIGLKILYHIINSIPYASAERVFAPGIDYEAHIRNNGILLASLEHRRPLRDFDILGFTLQYELSYTNVLNMLDLGGLPIRSSERIKSHPIVIAGGPCTANPVPLEPFIDVFVIGDGEEAIGEIVDVFNRGETQSARGDLLAELSELEGVYVPAVHRAEGKRIRRRWLDDIESAPFPVSPVVPYTSVVHDRIAIEISRGCAKGCRFCQAGMIYRPLRERSLENVLSLARQSIQHTGHEEISFTSLSTGDYSCLLPLIQRFNCHCHDQHISISLPSLRVGSIKRDILREIKSVRKTGFTLAPEAGSARLRNVINKDFTEEDYLNALQHIYMEGWTKLKLYFMIGLPSETSIDIEGIIRMAEIASTTGRKISGRRVQINIGISAFVPKAHTPFQWFGQAPIGYLRDTQDHLRRAFRNRGFSFRGQHVELSLIEAVLARGNEDCASLIETAWRSGCRFDGWSEHFRFDTWISAAKKTSLNLYDSASMSYKFTDRLPWRCIDTGISDDFLQSEYEKALKGDMTPDCRDGCYGCGLTCVNRHDSEGEATNVVTRMLPSFPPPSAVKSRIPQRLRVRFSKTGILRYLSHQEMVTTILRAIRRAHIRLFYSSGFHPHPKISFSPALPTGVEGINEYFDIEVPMGSDQSDLQRALTLTLPDGLAVHEVFSVQPHGSALNDLISCYDYEVQIDEGMEGKISSFLGLRQCIVLRNDTSCDIRPMVKDAQIRDGVLTVTIIDTERKARLHEILKEMFEYSMEKVQAIPVKRVGLYRYNREDAQHLIAKGSLWVEK